MATKEIRTDSLRAWLLAARPKTLTGAAVPVMLGCGLAFIGAALLVGAGAWAASKQIARLSALWARKVASPFWKVKGEKDDTAAYLAA